MGDWRGSPEGEEMHNTRRWRHLLPVTARTGRRHRGGGQHTLTSARYGRSTLVQGGGGGVRAGLQGSWRRMNEGKGGEGARRDVLTTTPPTPACVCPPPPPPPPCVAGVTHSVPSRHSTHSHARHATPTHAEHTPMGR
ncbi:hypothetical protein E2C01_101592 [Portunus trituberculatus]|uniref:Uncharacterized protein n=1 Tax=Portunus trituberculatus TaxID=210409 RepID=A0A5B7KB49_PORTR|nr:hypothetical protein [Portunus trituberculatus]